MQKATPFKLRQLALVLAASAALTGCASTNPRDPYEGFNRAVFKFNDAVDQAALKPAATVYKNVLPGFVQTGVGNFFGNLADVWTAANNLMQGKGEEGMSDVMRVAINSTFGLLGVLDIASEAGLKKHKEDFGQTLGAWGVPSGPYVMLPLLGPSTVRDTVGLPLDIAADPWVHNRNMRVRNVGTAVRVVDQRAALLDASTLLEDAALDRYEFIRDGFLQARENKVNDGEDQPRHNVWPLKTKPAAEDKPAESSPEAKPESKSDAAPAEGKPATAQADSEAAAPQAIMPPPAANTASL
ncbi:VacJ family lipoprotein [Massilia sp. NR 4-1]|uniref:MlaA family lipoprotein n=1 Tax=Massilia sp. NR 4-1 TaxID=1678028 RepID=UPI00067D0183|nr:VacJ family lipoprotein [Massilia sp. NR 4-1]AKU23369.1 ABC transporter [Massilia sp. NR 4-1]